MSRVYIDRLQQTIKSTIIGKFRELRWDGGVVSCKVTASDGRLSVPASHVKTRQLSTMRNGPVWMPFSQRGKSNRSCIPTPRSIRWRQRGWVSSLHTCTSHVPQHGDRGRLGADWIELSASCRHVHLNVDIGPRFKLRILARRAPNTADREPSSDDAAAVLHEVWTPCLSCLNPCRPRLECYTTLSTALFSDRSADRAIWVAEKTPLQVGQKRTICITYRVDKRTCADGEHRLKRDSVKYVASM